MIRGLALAIELLGFRFRVTGELSVNATDDYLDNKVGTSCYHYNMKEEVEQFLVDIVRQIEAFDTSLTN